MIQNQWLTVIQRAVARRFFVPEWGGRTRRRATARVANEQTRRLR